MKKPPKQLAGVRLTPEASATITSWARLTNKSANWMTSYAVNALRGCLISPEFSKHVTEELEALGRVQAELALSAKRVSAAKQKLAAIRQTKP